MGCILTVIALFSVFICKLAGGCWQMGEERGAPAARQPSSMRRNELLRTSSRFLVEKNRAKAPERAGLGCWGALCLSPASIRPHRAWPGLAWLS